MENMILYETEYLYVSAYTYQQIEAKVVNFTLLDIVFKHKCQLIYCINDFNMNIFQIKRY